MPIWTDTALPSMEITVLPFMYQPKLPVENCLTSASISWPLITTFIGSAFSRNWVSDTGQDVLGGMRPHLTRKRTSAPHPVGSVWRPHETGGGRDRNRAAARFGRSRPEVAAPEREV